MIFPFKFWVLEATTLSVHDGTVIYIKTICSFLASLENISKIYSVFTYEVLKFKIQWYNAFLFNFAKFQYKT